MITCLFYLLGFAFSCVLGQFVVGRSVAALWARVPAEPGSPSLRPPPIVQLWHGVLERALYTACIVCGRPEGIAVWLGFKAVMRYTGQPDTRHASAGPIYLIGTIMSLAFGVIGGWIALRRVTL